MTIHDWTLNATLDLKSGGVESARLDTLLLLEHVLQRPKEWVLAHTDQLLSAMDLLELERALKRRKAHEPLAYITGTKEFYGRSFLVNDSVLIPRPESEDIITLLLQVAKKCDINTVVDVGTGSGCLAITVKRELPAVHVMALDISEAALQVARRNARVHQAQIQCKKMDVCVGLPPMPKTRPYTIVANLPYVPDELVTSEEITKEPPIALFSGDNGLDHYHHFWQQVSNLLNKPHHIITEGLLSQHTQLVKMAELAGYTLADTRGLIQLFAANTY